MNNEHPDFYERDPSYDDEPVIYSSQLRFISEHFEAVLRHLYGNMSIDMESLERSLDEVANGLGLRLPYNDLNVIRKTG